MYAGSSAATASGVAEEYLLGKRRVDSVLNSQTSVSSTIKSNSKVPQNLLADDQSALDKDLMRRVREDPMFKIKQQELALKKKRALLNKVKKH